MLREQANSAVKKFRELFPELNTLSDTEIEKIISVYGGSEASDSATVTAIVAKARKDYAVALAVREILKSKYGINTDYLKDDQFYLLMVRNCGAGMSAEQYAECLSGVLKRNDGNTPDGSYTYELKQSELKKRCPHQDWDAIFANKDDFNALQGKVMTFMSGIIEATPKTPEQKQDYFYQKWCEFAASEFRNKYNIAGKLPEIIAPIEPIAVVKRRREAWN